jgi:hypothetical protein
MEEEYMEKASGGTFARTTRNTDEDEGRRRVPRKSGAFFGCDVNTVASAKTSKLEFLQTPHSQRDPPSIHSAGYSQELEVPFFQGMAAAE